MTEYKLHRSITRADDGRIQLHLQVGKRDRLEPIPLDRDEAFRLAEHLIAGLRNGEAQ